MRGKTKSVIGVIVFLLFSVIVFADAPPPIPTEYWGQLIIDGEPAPDGTEVKYFDGEEWIIATTQNGWYNLIMTGGDSPLTYNDDHDCSTHWANEEACIPCTQDVDCVEGPQDGDSVEILVNNTPVMVTWGDDASADENTIASIQLYSGWNMVSFPVEITNNGPNDVLSPLTGHKVAYHYDASDAQDHWKGYDSNTPPFTWDLLSMVPNKGYWLQVDTAQSLSVMGQVPAENSFSLYNGWNMVGFQMYEDTIQNTMDKLTGHRVAYHYDASDAQDHWKGYDSNTPPFTWDLEGVNIGRGYWVQVDSNQDWVE